MGLEGGEWIFHESIEAWWPVLCESEPVFVTVTSMLDARSKDP